MIIMAQMRILLSIFASPGEKYEHEESQENRQRSVLRVVHHCTSRRGPRQRDSGGSSPRDAIPDEIEDLAWYLISTGLNDQETGPFSGTTASVTSLLS